MFCLHSVWPYYCQTGNIGFQADALKPVHDYLSNRIQKVKTNEEFSSWKDIPVDTQRRFNVYKTSIRRRRRVYWDRIWCSTKIHSWLTSIHNTSLWPFALPWRHRLCKLCKWHYNIYRKRKESVFYWCNQEILTATF